MAERAGMPPETPTHSDSGAGPPHVAPGVVSPAVVGIKRNAVLRFSNSASSAEAYCVQLLSQADAVGGSKRGVLGRAYAGANRAGGYLYGRVGRLWGGGANSPTPR